MVLLAAGCLAGPAHLAHSSLDAPRPIAAHDTVFLEEMTWMEVRDALHAGKTTVLVPTGGIEQNGPYLATGKHNYIVRAVAQAVARRLGNALVAPIVPFVPEGNIDPPSGHMNYPGTISVSEDTYERLLTDICACLRVHGFRNIVLLGDSGGNQAGMQAVANRLMVKWRRERVQVHFLPQYYNYAVVARWLEGQGIHLESEDAHDDFMVTAQMLAANPSTVRMQQRLTDGRIRISGTAMAPAEVTEWGKKIIAFRAERTVHAIREAIQQ
jgi:creatinine amidohydrolase